MIQALTCPSCQHASAVAGDVSLQAILRCRHCGNQIVLGETVDHALDSWEVIDDPGALVAAAVEGEAAVAGEAAQEMEVAESLPDLELVDNEISQDEPQQVPPTPAKQKFDWSKYDTNGYEPLRARKKPRSPLWSILSVASGGLAAIPIATLLIWHLLGKDPLELGPTVARYVPWIVPSQFHPYENQNQFRQSARIIPDSSPQRGSSGFRQFDEFMPAPDADRENQVSDSAAATEPSANERPEISRFEATEPTTGASDSPQSSTVDAPASTVEVPNVFSVIKRVEADLEAWIAGQEQLEAKKKLAMQLYADLAELALMIDDQPSNNPILRLINDQLQPVGRDVKERTDVQSLIQAGARYWIASHPAEGKLGLGIVGEVTEATAINGEWELVISPEIGGSQPLRVVVPGLLNPSLMAGQRLLLLGIVTREFTDATSELPASAPDGITFVANYLYAF